MIMTIEITMDGFVTENEEEKGEKKGIRLEQRDEQEKEEKESSVLSSTSTVVREKVECDGSTARRKAPKTTRM